MSGKRKRSKWRKVLRRDGVAKSVGRKPVVAQRPNLETEAERAERIHKTYEAAKANVEKMKQAEGATPKPSSKAKPKKRYKWKRSD